LDQVHHEVGLTALGLPGIEHLGDVRVVHHRQRLSFGLEPGNDLLGSQGRCILLLFFRWMAISTTEEDWQLKNSVNFSLKRFE
jgi:hypothetical protein